MSDRATGRMLLSHNFNLFQGELPVLSREEFAQVFIDGLQSNDRISCSPIENPHWVVEILFPIAEFSPEEIGKICGKILWSKRQEQKSDDRVMPDILLLGGKKTTPAMGTSPTSLQPGEWGVDVVETASAAIFLSGIQWEKTISQKPIDTIFQIELLGKNTQDPG